MAIKSLSRQRSLACPSTAKLRPRRSLRARASRPHLTRVRAGRPRSPGLLHVHPGAHLVHKSLGAALRQAADRERIEAAAALDGDGVPYEAALMSHLGEVRHRQMFILPGPGRQPKLDLHKGDTELVGGQVVGENELREAALEHRPQPARLDLDWSAGAGAWSWRWACGCAHQCRLGSSALNGGARLGGAGWLAHHVVNLVTFALE